MKKKAPNCRICNCLGFNFNFKRLPFVIFVPVISRLLFLWKTISDPISAFSEINPNAEEHLDHLDVLQSAEQAGSDRGTEGFAGVISEATAIIFECSRSNREISKAQQGLGPG